MTSSLPHQSASDWQSAFADLADVLGHSASEPLATSAPAPAAPVKVVNDDDLGFDPFHETQKALAEMLEKESISNGYGGSGGSGHSSLPPPLAHPQQPAHLNYGNGVAAAPAGVHLGHSSLYSNASVAPPLTRHSPNQFGLGLTSLSAGHQQPARTRIPPPGFNPTALCSQPSSAVNSFGLNSRQGAVRGGASGLDSLGSSKMLPFMNSSGHASANGTGASSPLSALGPRLFGETASALDGMGLGMALVNVNNMGYAGLGQNTSLGNHMSTAAKPHQGRVHSVSLYSASVFRRRLFATIARALIHLLVHDTLSSRLLLLSCFYRPPLKLDFIDSIRRDQLDFWRKLRRHWNQKEESELEEHPCVAEKNNPMINDVESDRFVSRGKNIFSPETL